MKIGAPFLGRVTLADGGRASVRAIRPADAGALREAFLALSPESRYQRFLGHVSDLTPEMLRHLSDVDGFDHVALVACDASGSIVGVARFVRSTERPDTAEVAVTVAEERRRRGLGAALLDALVARAAARGVTRFVAHVLHDNVAIRRLLARAGPLGSSSDGAIVVALRRARCAPLVAVEAIARRWMARRRAADASPARRAS